MNTCAGQGLAPAHGGIILYDAQNRPLPAGHPAYGSPWYQEMCAQQYHRHAQRLHIGPPDSHQMAVRPMGGGSQFGSQMSMGSSQVPQSPGRKEDPRRPNRFPTGSSAAGSPRVTNSQAGSFHGRSQMKGPQSPTNQSQRPQYRPGQAFTHRTAPMHRGGAPGSVPYEVPKGRQNASPGYRSQANASRPGASSPRRTIRALLTCYKTQDMLLHEMLRLLPYSLIFKLKVSVHLL